jgi:hypothetical protein
MEINKKNIKPVIHACLTLGNWYLNGSNVEKDSEKAIHFYNKMCNADFVEGCSSIGDMYFLGQGVEQDDLKAFMYYSKGCDGGDVSTCAGLYQKKGEVIDEQKLLKPYEKSCEKGKVGLVFEDNCEKYISLKKWVTSLGMTVSSERNLDHNENEGIDVPLIEGRFWPINHDGTPNTTGPIIRDISTNLEWLRCSVGQIWNASSLSCDGEATKHYWQEGAYLKTSAGFVLPTIEQLNSLVYCSSGLDNKGESTEFGIGSDRHCGGDYLSPVIQADAFPNTPADKFWIMPDDNCCSYADLFPVAVNFGDGSQDGEHWASRFRMRLVRKAKLDQK